MYVWCVPCCVFVSRWAHSSCLLRVTVKRTTGCGALKQNLCQRTSGSSCSHSLSGWWCWTTSSETQVRVCLCWHFHTVFTELKHSIAYQSTFVTFLFLQWWQFFTCIDWLILVTMKMPCIIFTKVSAHQPFSHCHLCSFALHKQCWHCQHICKLISVLNLHLSSWPVILISLCSLSPPTYLRMKTSSSSALLYFDFVFLLRSREWQLVDQVWEARRRRRGTKGEVKSTQTEGVFTLLQHFHRSTQLMFNHTHEFKQTHTWVLHALSWLIHTGHTGAHIDRQ